MQAGKWYFERGLKRSKMTFFGLKMIIFGHFSRFLASLKIYFSSLHNPIYNTCMYIFLAKLDHFRVQLQIFSLEKLSNHNS